MRILSAVLAASCCLATPNFAHADPAWFTLPKVSLSLGVSTLGAGGTLGLHNPNSLFGARISANFFHFGINFDRAGARSRAQANFQNETIMVDLYPWRKNFHVTAGIVFNQNSANYSSTPEITGTLLSFLENAHYNGVVGDVRGPISFNPIAPYLGIGYNYNTGKNWTLSGDIGGMYQGNGRITVTPTGLLASNPRARAEIVSNANKADRMINKMSFYPIISFQIGYRF